MSILLVENPKFVQFEQNIIIPPVPTFRMGDFFNNKGEFPLSFGEDFGNFFIDIFENSEFYLNEEINLNKFKLIKNSLDDDIKFDFKETTFISIKIFLPILKSLLEAYFKDKLKKNSLNTSIDSVNAFHVTLTENPDVYSSFSVYVRWFGSMCFCDSVLLNSNESFEPLPCGGYFYAL